MAEKVKPPRSAEERRARRAENRFDVALILIVVALVGWIATS